MSKQNESLREELENTNTFNSNVYLGQEINQHCLPFDKALDEILELLDHHISKAVIEERKEKFRILESLGDMYEQYCGGKTGHDFMGAGEGAISILEDYSLSKDDFHIADDWEIKLAELKAKQELSQ